MTSQKARLGELMVGAGVLDAAALSTALAEQRRSGGKLGEVLLRLALVTEAQLTDFLAQQLQLSSVALPLRSVPPPSVLARIPAHVAISLGVLPLDYREEERCLVVAVAEPLRGERLERLRGHAGCWLLPRLAPERALREALLRAYGALPSVEDAVAAPLAAAQPVAAGALVAGVPVHPEVRALAALLINKGLITAAELARHLGVDGVDAVPTTVAASSEEAAAPTPRLSSERTQPETTS